MDSLPTEISGKPKVIPIIKHTEIGAELFIYTASKSWNQYLNQSYLSCTCIGINDVLSLSEYSIKNSGEAAFYMTNAVYFLK